MAGMRRWVATAAAGLLLWTALVTPLSVAIGDYLAYYDPQSDPERFEHHRDLAVHVYTAGHWLGQLVAALTGVRLVTAGRAAAAGGILGLVTGVVAIVAGLRPLRAGGHAGVAPDPTMLSDPAVRWCVVASLALFPLWAVAGAAVGGLVRRGAPLVVVAAFLSQPATLLLGVGVAAPPSSHPLAVSVIAGAGPAALLMPAILLAWTAAATTAAIMVRRRRARRPPGDCPTSIP